MHVVKQEKEKNTNVLLVLEPSCHHGEMEPASVENAFGAFWTVTKSRVGTLASAPARVPLCGSSLRTGDRA